MNRTCKNQISIMQLEKWTWPFKTQLSTIRYDIGHIDLKKA
jgi:hypothetical protein